MKTYIKVLLVALVVILGGCVPAGYVEEIYSRTTNKTFELSKGIVERIVDTEYDTVCYVLITPSYGDIWCND